MFFETKPNRRIERDQRPHALPQIGSQLQMTVQNNQFFPRLAAANPEKSNSQDVFLFSCINRLIPTCHFVMQSGPA